MIIHHTNALADGIGALREGINDGMRMAAYAQNIKDAKLRREQRQEQETREQAGETRAAEMHALSMASTQANQEEQTGLRPLRMRQAQAQTGALEAQSKIAQSDASYRSNYDQASAADPELKIVDKGMQDLLRQTEEQYGEALPPEVKQRFQERVETMREIQGRTPQERTQSRARYGDESQQFLQSEMKPHAEKRAKNLIGTLVDNQEFQKDPLAFQALSQLQQAVSKPGSQYDANEIHQRVTAIQDAHAGRAANEAGRQDFQVAAEQELNAPPSAFRPPLTFQQKERIRGLQTGVLTSKYDGKMGDAHEKMREILAETPEGAEMEGSGRRWEQASPKARARIYGEALKESRQALMPLLRDDRIDIDEYEQRASKMAEQRMGGPNGLAAAYGWDTDAGMPQRGMPFAGGAQSPFAGGGSAFFSPESSSAILGASSPSEARAIGEAAADDEAPTLGPKKLVPKNKASASGIPGAKTAAGGQGASGMARGYAMAHGHAAPAAQAESAPAAAEKPREFRSANEAFKDLDVRASGMDLASVEAAIVEIEKRWGIKLSEKEGWGGISKESLRRDAGADDRKAKDQAAKKDRKDQAAKSSADRKAAHKALYDLSARVGAGETDTETLEEAIRDYEAKHGALPDSQKKSLLRKKPGG